MEDYQRLSYYRQPVDDVLAELKTTSKGLTETEAAKRLQLHGFNRLQIVRHEAALTTLLRQFKNLLVLMLLLCAAFGLYLQDLKTAVILLFIAILNAAVGYFQEHKAETPMKGLGRLLASQAKVLRSGRLTSVDSTKLVAGDVVYVESGDSVPADLRILDEEGLASNDFDLTGENNPSRKFIHAISASVPLANRHNLLFMGTTIASGTGYGVVIATGMQSELGRIASLSQVIPTTPSQLQKEMAHLARRIAQVSAVLAALLTLVALSSHLGLHESIAVGIGIGAAMIPSALIAEVTITLTQTANRLAKAKALVKKLATIETLAATNYILTDKTGPLTSNEMTVEVALIGRTLYKTTGSGYEVNGHLVNERGVAVGSKKLKELDLFFATGVFAGNAKVKAPDDDHPGWYVVGDPTEGALITLARKAGLDPDAWNSANPELKGFQFDSARKLLSSIRQRDGQLMVFIKGAPENVLTRSRDLWDHGHIRPLTAADRSFFNNHNERQASSARHSLAFAYRLLPANTDLSALTMEDVEQQLTFLGLVSIVDPLRSTVPAAMIAAARAHIKVSIIASDFPATAKAVALKANLGKDVTVILGDELAGLADTQILQLMARGGAVFSRVAPEDKLRIVEIVKHSGGVVAVTGDSINDAPALQRADIGVAMGRAGNNVAQNAAEIILLDDSFTTLVSAIEQGRLSYQNIRKAAHCVLTANAGELFTVLLGLAALAALRIAPAITPIQILAIDIVAQLLPITALGWDAPLSRLMREQPRNLHDHIINRRTIMGFIGFGALAALLSYGNYLFFFIRHNLSPQFIATDTPLYLQATTLTWLSLILCLNVYLVFERADAHENFFTSYLWGNKRLLIAFGGSFFLIINVIYNPFVASLFGTGPLSASDWLTALAAAGLYFGLRLSQRHTRKHSRRAVFKLHHEVHGSKT